MYTLRILLLKVKQRKGNFWLSYKLAFPLRILGEAKMEMIKENPEMVSPGRSRLCLVGGGAVEAKCIKRRRRDPSAVALSTSDQQQQVQQLPQVDQQQTPTATTVKRSSRFRGVSRHRWTGRYEAHLWDKGSWNPTQRKKGKQVYLGAYDEEESAARAYDLAALKYWGTSTFTNFPVSDYEKEIEIMKTVTKEEYLASLRRRSSGFSRGVSKYRGVARHHHNGRWEARIGRVFGNKYLYLGTYSTQEEAAHAYDIAAIEYRGINAVTNFDLSTYSRWLKPAGSSYNPPLRPQELKPVLEPLPMGTYSNQIPRGRETQLSFFQPNPFINITDDLNLNSPKTEENFFPGKSLISPCTKSSSSPTALSLLLKSSIFKELVKKHSSSVGDGTDENKTQIVPSAGNNNEVRDYFYNGNSNFPCLNMCPSDQGVLRGLDSKENSSSLLWYK